jgi:hypothetical protein
MGAAWRISTMAARRASRDFMAVEGGGEYSCQNACQWRHEYSSRSRDLGRDAAPTHRRFDARSARARRFARGLVETLFARIV